MSELTNLEKASLKIVCKRIKKINEVYEKNSDSFQDILHDQLEIDCEEPQTFKQFLLVVKQLNCELDVLVEHANLLEEHFLT
jgi:hypothetical protein